MIDEWDKLILAAAESTDDAIDENRRLGFLLLNERTYYDIDHLKSINHFLPYSNKK